MTTLEQPSMAINDPRVMTKTWLTTRTRRFQMWNTWDIRETETRAHIIEWVAAVARSAPGGKLLNLVISCHGLPAWLQLGEGFDQSHIPDLAAWQGLIGKIWFPACLVAQIPDAATQAQLNKDYPTFKTGDGNLFCSALARTVHSYVVAPTEIQCDYIKTFPTNQISSFEGLVLSYGPDGYVSWSQRIPSTSMKHGWFDKQGTCVAVPD